MGTGQGPIKIQTGNALDVAETTSNVATNKAELAALAANIDGKDTYPNSVKTEHLSAADAQIHGAFRSGSIDVTQGGVSISSAADGATPTTGLYMDSTGFMLYKGGEAQVTFDNSTGDASFTGAVYATSGSFPGSIVTGTLNVGEGGITISGGTGGVSIVGNQIFLGTAGSPTVLLDGSTGIITATKFQMTADGDSSLDMSLGSLTIGAGTSVGGTTTVGDIASDASQAASDASAALGAAAAALEVADGEIVGYYQNDAPASGMKFGDIWIDTNYAGFPTTSAIFRYQDTSGGSSGTLAWRAAPTNAIGKVYLNAYTAQSTATGAANTAASKITTFYQSTTPTALVAGDLWVHTGEGNKLYRAGAAGIYNWVAVQDAGVAAGATAIQPGNGVAVDGSKYITTINMSSGLTIKTSTSNTRSQMTSDGFATYNSGNELVVQVDHTNGVWINNASEASNPGAHECMHVAYGGTEVAWIGATSASNVTLVSAGSLHVTGNTALHLTNVGGDVEITNLYTNGMKIEGGGIDPTITAGSAPSEGGASGQPLGSLLLATGGSLWLTYYNSGNKWTRIFGANVGASLAHPT